MALIKEVKKGNFVLYNSKPFFVKEVILDSGSANLVLQDLFSDKSELVCLGLDSSIEEADVRRKCGSLLFMKKGKAEILDTETFEQFKADVSAGLDAKDGDPVTFIRFGDLAKVVEIRRL